MAENSRITILGTISDIKALSMNRTGAGTVLNVDDSQILIDPGVGTIIRAAQSSIDLSQTNIMLVSSKDTIYTNDINAVIEHTNKDMHLICPSTLLKHDESILTSEHAKGLKIVPIASEDKSTMIKGIQIHIYAAKNDAVSYKIHTSKYILGYMTKAKYSKALTEKFKHCNILIINLANIKDKNSEYLDLEEITEMIKEINPELVILNGFSRKTVDSDPLDISRKIKLTLQNFIQKVPTQVLPAKEMMVINPESYNIKLKQKSLKGFVE